MDRTLIVYFAMGPGASPARGTGVAPGDGEGCWEIGWGGGAPTGRLRLSVGVTMLLSGEATALVVRVVVVDPEGVDLVGGRGEVEGLRLGRTLRPHEHVAAAALVGVDAGSRGVSHVHA